ncbi:MAG: adenylosuccinate synthase [Clostridiales bacterium]|nr:MAG: adenylosuccinate synthase [Clostridiales bacterium]
MKISKRAHVVFPYHREMDALAETAKGEAKIGTTKKGIGPCYMDKVARDGIRIGDMLKPASFAEKLRLQVERKNQIAKSLYGVTPFDYQQIYREYSEYAERLKPMVCDTVAYLNDAREAGKNILLEGAQGTLLDIDLGTYPYVTSSHPTSGGFTIGTGLAANRIDSVLGITKAYTTRVGSGPFVTEQDNPIGDRIRKQGNEFGVTTGRPRRCGWLDLVIVRHAVRVNGLTGIALSLLDVLSGFDELKVCRAYQIDGVECVDFPADLEDIAAAKPVYQNFAGWQEDITACTSYQELPDNAKRYIDYIEQFLGVPVAFISVGAKRSQTIIRQKLF